MEVQGHDRANRSPKLDNVQVGPDPHVLFLQGPFCHGRYNSENVQYAENSVVTTPKIYNKRSLQLRICTLRNRYSSEYIQYAVVTDTNM